MRRRKRRIAMNVIFIPKRTRINQKNEFPIYARITINKERAEFSTHQFCTEQIWNGGTPKEPLATELSEVRISLNEIFKDLTNTNNVSAITVKAAFLGKEAPVNKTANIPPPEHQVQTSTFVAQPNKKPSFEQVFKAYMDYLKLGKKRLKPLNTKTIGNYERRFNRFLKFIFNCYPPGTTPQDLNKDVYDRYYNYLLSCQYGINYRSKLLNLVKSFFTYAVDEGYVEKNFFNRHRSVYVKPKKVVVPDHELKVLETYTPKNKILEEIQDLFLLQCNTGLAYGDLWVDFSHELAQHDGVTFIHHARKKTGAMSTIPVNEKARQILVKYNYKLPKYGCAYYNRLLKEIMQETGIKTWLTTHVGRKTMGQRKIDKGYSLEAVAAMMGHTDTKTTQQDYITVDEKRILHEMQRIQMPFASAQQVVARA